jgi:ATP-dependent Clp protease adaptor protein ClpS
LRLPFVSQLPLFWERRTPTGSINAGSQVMSDKKDGRSDQGDGTGNGAGTGVVTKTRPKTLILNDDYTPMEFVVHILERFFNKGRDEAVQIMLHVHRHGVGICGVFTYEVAETKVAQVIEFARRHQHPLQCTMEKE